MKSQIKFPKHHSFEFFPPKTEQGAEKLRNVTRTLSQLKPKFFSVTFGAGGSTIDKTLETALEIKQAGSQVAPHISCISSSKSDIKTLLDKYQASGIKHIFALRGDLPSGSYTAGELAYASDLIQYIREIHGNHFHIDVACYPEFHPQAKSVGDDIQNLKRKLDAGANSAVTQYFYNADAYFRFIDQCEKIGIDAPIVPGIMPIVNYTKLSRFSDACGAEIPRWIRKQLEAYGDDRDSIIEFGTEVVTKLCDVLLKHGAPGIHFYTMNQASTVARIWDNLGLTE